MKKLIFALCAAATLTSAVSMNVYAESEEKSASESFFDIYNELGLDIDEDTQNAISDLLGGEFSDFDFEKYGIPSDIFNIPKLDINLEQLINDYSEKFSSFISEQLPDAASNLSVLICFDDNFAELDYIESFKELHKSLSDMGMDFNDLDISEIQDAFSELYNNNKSDIMDKYFNDILGELGIDKELVGSLSENASAYEIELSPELIAQIVSSDKIKYILSMDEDGEAVSGIMSELDKLPDLSNFLPGDSNNDGRFDLADTVTIMQALANPSKYQLSDIGFDCADIFNHGDGVTYMDALTIQKWLLGLYD